MTSAEAPPDLALSLLESTPAELRSLPLVLRPRGACARKVEYLSAMLAAERPWVESALAAHGALLIREAPVAGPKDFEKVALALCPGLKNDYLGTSPRDALTTYVFSASELPPYYPIPQHCEMSFIKKPPGRLLFSCLLAPTGEGGETPLCDFRRVYADLDPAVRERFETRGVTIIRNYNGPDGGGRFELWQLKRWHEMFRTTDREKVEEICLQNDFVPTWLDGGKLRLLSHQPAVRLHPKTGEKVWFNHSQVFHLSSAAGEYKRLSRRQDPLRLAALGWFARGMAGLQRTLRPLEEQVLHCTFGDGSEISEADMEAVREAIWKNLVIYPWQTRDILLIDNYAISHGRTPYHGPRKVVVAWS